METAYLIHMFPLGLQIYIKYGGDNVDDGGADDDDHCYDDDDDYDEDDNCYDDDDYDGDKMWW